MRMRLLERGLFLFLVAVLGLALLVSCRENGDRFHHDDDHHHVRESARQARALLLEARDDEERDEEASRQPGLQRR